MIDFTMETLRASYSIILREDLEVHAHVSFTFEFLFATYMGMWLILHHFNHQRIERIKIISTVIFSVSVCLKRLCLHILSVVIWIQESCFYTSGTVCGNYGTDIFWVVWHCCTSKALIIFRWLDTKRRNLQCISNGETPGSGFGCFVA